MKFLSMCFVCLSTHEKPKRDRRKELLVNLWLFRLLPDANKFLVVPQNHAAEMFFCVLSQARPLLNVLTASLASEIDRFNFENRP